MSGLSVQNWIFKSERRTNALKWVLRRLASESGRLGPSSHVWLEPMRLSLLRPLQAVIRRPLTREKPLRGSKEYLCSVTTDDVSVTTALDDFGWSGPNYISTKKYRMVDGSRQYTSFSWVHRESLGADWQDHMWAYPAYGDGPWAYDLYLHTEPNLVSRPKEHTEGPWKTGDVNYALRGALEAAGVPYGQNPSLLKSSSVPSDGE